MKTLKSIVAKVLLGLVFLSMSLTVSARVDADSTKAKGGEFVTTADLVSSYVWRGVKYSGVSIQPGVKYTDGGFTLGTWGSAGFDGVMEMDLYTSYAIGGLTLGVTDYYYPGSSFFDYKVDLNAADISSHWLEANLSYALKSLTIKGNYMFLTNSADPDMYFELAYAFKKFNLFVGGGNGWHTTDAEFQVCNIGISALKEIKFSNTFTLPVTGAVILNPNTEQFFITATASF